MVIVKLILCFIIRLCLMLAIQLIVAIQIHASITLFVGKVHRNSFAIVAIPVMRALFVTHVMFSVFSDLKLKIMFLFCVSFESVIVSGIQKCTVGTAKG